MNPKFKGLLMAVVFLALGTAVVAQRGPGDGPPREGRRGPRAETPRPGGPGIGNLDRLTAALDLNAAQVTTIESLIEMRAQEAEIIRDQIEASRENLDALIESGDALAVGNAVLAEHALRNQIQEIEARFMADLRNVLTPAQEETLEGIEAMMGGRRGFGEGPGPGPRRGRGGPPAGALN